MAFRTKRGRPRQNFSTTTDSGTPELRLKHALGLTQEPLDALLARGTINAAQHRAGLHFRWLYTLRYGVPSVRARGVPIEHAGLRSDGNPEWRYQRELEFREACKLLAHYQLLPPVTHITLYALHDGLHPAVAVAARDGLELLREYWKSYPHH
jgi:hypothetical protein